MVEMVAEHKLFSDLDIAVSLLGPRGHCVTLLAPRRPGYAQDGWQLSSDSTVPLWFLGRLHPTTSCPYNFTVLNQPLAYDGPGASKGSHNFLLLSSRNISWLHMVDNMWACMQLSLAFLLPTMQSLITRWSSRFKSKFSQQKSSLKEYYFQQMLHDQ